MRLTLATANDLPAHLDVESLRNHAGHISRITYSMAIGSPQEQATPAQLPDLQSKASLFTTREGDESLWMVT